MKLGTGACLFKLGWPGAGGTVFLAADSAVPLSA